jgi:hypothetical protein
MDRAATNPLCVLNQLCGNQVQLRQVMKEKKMRDGEGFQTDETLLASQLLAFCGVAAQFIARWIAPLQIRCAY